MYNHYLSYQIQWICMNVQDCAYVYLHEMGPTDVLPSVANKIDHIVNTINEFQIVSRLFRVVRIPPNNSEWFLGAFEHIGCHKYGHQVLAIKMATLLKQCAHVWFCSRLCLVHAWFGWFMFDACLVRLIHEVGGSGEGQVRDLTRRCAAARHLLKSYILDLIYYTLHVIYYISYIIFYM